MTLFTNMIEPSDEEQLLVHKFIKTILIYPFSK